MAIMVSSVPNMDERPLDPIESRMSGDRLLDNERGGTTVEEVDMEDVSSKPKSSWYLFLLTLSIGG